MTMKVNASPVEEVWVALGRPSDRRDSRECGSGKRRTVCTVELEGNSRVYRYEERRCFSGDDVCTTVIATVSIPRTANGARESSIDVRRADNGPIERLEWNNILTNMRDRWCPGMELGQPFELNEAIAIALAARQTT